MPFTILGLRPSINVMGIYTLGGVFNSSQPQAEEHPSPTSGPIIDVAFNHGALSHIVAVDPTTGKMWVTSSGATTLMRIDLDPANGRAGIGETASNAAFRAVRGFSFTPTGRMIVCANGSALPSSGTAADDGSPTPTAPGPGTSGASASAG